MTQQTPTDETQVSTSGAGDSEPLPVQTVVWGDARDIPDKRALTYHIGDQTYKIRRVGEGIVQVNHVESDDPPFLASSGTKKGSLRMGHTRQPRPLILRFPRPVTVFPGSTFECYSSYPTTPGLFYEVPDKKPVHLLDLPGKTLQKTHYGNITGGVICNLHMGEHRDSPEKIPDDPQLATVRIRIKNKSEEPESVGVLLLYPPLLDFSVLDNRLCLNIVELSLLSSEEGDIKHLKRPSLDGATLVESRLEEASRSNALDLFRSVMGFRTMESGF